MSRVSDCWKIAWSSDLHDPTCKRTFSLLTTENLKVKKLNLLPLLMKWNTNIERIQIVKEKFNYSSCTVWRIPIIIFPWSVVIPTLQFVFPHSIICTPHTNQTLKFLFEVAKNIWVNHRLIALCPTRLAMATRMTTHLGFKQFQL